MAILIIAIVLKEFSFGSKLNIDCKFLTKGHY